MKVDIPLEIQKPNDSEKIKELSEQLVKSTNWLIYLGICLALTISLYLNTRGQKSYLSDEVVKLKAEIADCKKAEAKPTNVPMR